MNPPFIPEAHPVVSEYHYWSVLSTLVRAFSLAVWSQSQWLQLVLDVATANQLLDFCRSELAISSSLCFSLLTRWLTPSFPTSWGADHLQKLVCYPCRNIKCCLCVWKTILEQTHLWAERECNSVSKKYWRCSSHQPLSKAVIYHLPSTQ